MCFSVMFLNYFFGFDISVKAFAIFENEEIWNLKKMK